MPLRTRLRSATGLGDLIAAITGTDLSPFARLAEWFARSVLKRHSCGCALRRSRLNSLVPFAPPKLAAKSALAL